MILVGTLETNFFFGGGGQMLLYRGGRGREDEGVGGKGGEITRPITSSEETPTKPRMSPDVLVG